MFATNTRLAQLFDTMVSHGQLIGESEKEKNGSGSKTRSAVRRSLTLQNLPRPPDNLNPSASVKKKSRFKSDRVSAGQIRPFVR